MRHTSAMPLALIIVLTSGAYAYTPTPTRTPVPTPTPVIPADAFQVRYAANLQFGESVIDLTNTGAQGGDHPEGNICANVYVFSPDEQLISCCSCLLTPNSLNNLEVNRDLTSRTLTGVIPTSVVVKLLASKPAGTGTSCTNSASAVTTSNLVSGLRAWGTTIHQSPVAGTFDVTETEFTPSTLSASELDRLTSLCGFIQDNGSGFGICFSCRPGGS